MNTTLNKARKKRLFLTFKFPLQIIAVFTIAFLVLASILYFYDTLVSAFKKLALSHFLTETMAGRLSWMMAFIIGLGIFVESAAVIWDTLSYWGQCIDNYFIKRFTREEYFLNKANRLLEDTRILVNKANLDLQTITLKNHHLHRVPDVLEVLQHQYEKIKINCAAIHKTLESQEAEDKINLDYQNHCKELLNNLVTQNLQIGDRIEMLHEQLEKLQENVHEFPSPASGRGN